VIFLSEWVKACTLEQVKEGQLFGFIHDNTKILLANLKGKILATDLICTHADADLSSPFVRPFPLTC
jgi:nitrite reductase/ring-hydroxylating ferredoxin subunit